MRNKDKVLSMFQALFGEKRAQHEYADIIFGVGAGEKKRSSSRIHESKFTQFLTSGRFEKSVLQGVKKSLSLTWFDDDFTDEKMPSIDNVVDAVEGLEKKRCDNFQMAFAKISLAICDICDNPIQSKEDADKNLLKILWAGERLLLVRSSKIDFTAMKRISVMLDKAAQKSIASYPALFEYVQGARLAALEKMGLTWREALEKEGGEAFDDLHDRRRTVLEIYSRLSGHTLSLNIVRLFCGAEKKLWGYKELKSRDKTI